MKVLMVWVALGGLVSACGLEVGEAGDSTSPPPPPQTAPPGLPLSALPPGSFGGGGTAEEPRTVGGGGGAGAEEPPEPLRREIRSARDSSPGCFSNEDCGAGLCVNGQCRAFCEGDAGCAEGDACVLGVCRADAGRGWECVDQTDCSEDEDCVGGDCLRRCLRDGHCNVEGLGCSFGYCGLIR